MDISVIELKNCIGHSLVKITHCTDYMDVPYITKAHTRPVHCYNYAGFHNPNVTREELESFAIKILSSLGYKIKGM